MRRREFITFLGGAAIAAWPPTAYAQERVRRIGILMTQPLDGAVPQGRLAAMIQRLAQLGWVEGRNLRIDTHPSMPEIGTIERDAKALVASRPDLIVTPNTPVTSAILKQTRNIPIVFVNVSDPVGAGFVASLSRPGGNATGFIDLEGSLAGKWLELLKEIAPRLASASLVFNPVGAPYADYYLDPFKAAARSMGATVIAAPIHDLRELEAAVVAQARDPNGGLVVMPDTFTISHRAEIAMLAARHRLPAVYSGRPFVEAGGLVSYGIDGLDQYRRAAGYIDSILRGAKPSELPVQAPTKFELAINLKTAKALGLDVPWILQQRADEVIE